MLLSQSNISAKNIQMAAAWAIESDVAVASFAQLVAEIGRAHPRKRGRLPYVRRHNPLLWKRMLAAGLVGEWSNEVPSAEDSDELDLPPAEASDQSAEAESSDDGEEIPF